jgi:hypothetical protein
MTRKTVLAAVLTGILSVAGFGQLTDDVVFMHHSCGANWLGSGLHSALLAKFYVDERNDIYYGTAMSPDTGRPASLGSIPGDSTDMNHWVPWFNDYLGRAKVYACATGVNRIIMFKSCYPNSDVTADGTLPGDPFSSTKTLTNYKAVFRHANGPGNTYLRSGYTYRPLEDIFAANPDTLFVFVTAPPLVYTGTSDANAHRVRLFNNWVKTEWLASYNASHPGLNNVAVFDLFDVLAYPDADASHPNRLRAEYGGAGGDSHPNAAGNQQLTRVYCTNPGDSLDVAWRAFNNVAADFDGDKHCDVVDLLTFVPIFGYGFGEPGYDPQCDLNNDAAVDVVDLLIFVENFGT